MTEKLEKIQSDHEKMVIELEQEQKLRCDQLKAALVGVKSSFLLSLRVWFSL